MSEIEPDRIYHYRELPKLIPGNPSLSTVRRWINRGVNSGGFRRIQVHARAGREIYVTGQAVIDFLTFEVESESSPAIPRRSPAKRSSASRDAREKLRKYGI